jgi:prepilin-type N-terminal cleavage/methylation domain-containing protein
MPRRGFTLTELVFVVIIICIIIVLLTPFIKDIRNKAKIIACEENLEKIGLGLRLYASEHQEKFPPNLGELIEDGYVESERSFDCPSSQRAGTAGDPDYHYVTGYTVSSPSESVLIFDKAENHKEGKHVLYINGDIEWQAQGAVAE